MVTPSINDYEIYKSELMCLKTNDIPFPQSRDMTYVQNIFNRPEISGKHIDLMLIYMICELHGNIDSPRPAWEQLWLNNFHWIFVWKECDIKRMEMINDVADSADFFSIYFSQFDNYSYIHIEHRN